MPIAITREVSSSISRCELTHLAREPIDLDLARSQHRRYEDCLAAQGCEIRRLPEEPDLPDAVFVEDTALVLEELAILTRPGAETRRPETAAVAETLEHLRPLVRIEPPGTLDGGDLLAVDHTIFAGLSGRTNAAGVDQLRRHVEPFGYRIRPVEVGMCLHLKSAVTGVAEGTLLVQREWVDARSLAGARLIDVAAGEMMGANALWIGGRVIYPSAHVRTRERLESLGIEVVTVDVSELAKAEGGVTCCSLIVND